MKKVLSSFVLVFLASVALLLTACSSSKSDPTPTTGVVNGVISPAGSVTTVTATSSTNQTTTAIPNAGGSYEINGLAPGTYTLSFTAASGYSTPASQIVTVTTGTTTTATPVTVTTGSGSAGSGTWTVDSATRSGSVNATLQSNILTLVMLDLSGGTSVLMTVAGFNGTTTSFSLGNTSTYLLYSVGTTQQWSTFSPGGSGTLTFSSINTTTKKISGTFTASAPAYNGATGTKMVTGSFTNVTYQ